LVDGNQRARYKTRMKSVSSLAFFLGLMLLTSGCASTIPFKVGHEKLKDPPTTREGVLMVKTLVDRRAVTNAMQIGGKWAKAKPAYVAKQDRPVADIVTDGIREALEKVNYKIQSTPDATTPVLEGEMFEFWLTDNWSGAFCKIGVVLRLRQGEGGTVLWEKRLRAEEDDMVIIPNAMQAAMNSLLRSAVEEFSSGAFAEAVAGRKQVY